MTRIKPIVPYLLILLLGAAAYSRSFHAPFIFDDIPAIIQNSHIRHLWPITEAVKALPGWPLAGRPVVAFTMALNYAWGRYSPVGYHVFNLAVHLLCAMLILTILRLALQTPPLAERFGQASTGLATAVAALWVIHPLNTEAVIYIVQRTELLVTLFYLLTLWLAIRSFSAWRPLPWIVAAVVACALGMGSKEVMVSAPLMVLLYDRTLISGSFRDALRRHKGLYAGLASTWVILVLILLQSPRGVTVSVSHGMTSLDYLRTQARAIVWYLRLSFYPHPLSVTYPLQVIRSWSAAWPWCAIVSLLLGATAWAIWSGWASGLTGALFFMVLAPSSSVVPIISEVIAERRMYLPLAGLLALLVIGGYGILTKLAKHGANALPQPLAAGLAAVLTLVLVWVTVQRVKVYQTAGSIWGDAVASNPNDPGALNNLGEAMAEAGSDNQAINLYKLALAVSPDYIDARINLGNAYLRQGKYEEAIPNFVAALKRDNKNEQARLNLADCLSNLGRFAEAQAQLEQVLLIDPKNAAGQGKLGTVLIRLGKPEEALPYLAKAVQLQPDDVGLQMNDGAALLDAGKAVEALVHYGKVLQINPDHVEAQLRVASILLEQRHNGEAEVHLREALRVDPKNAEAHRLLASSLAAQGKNGEAIEQFRTVEHANPHDADAHHNLAVALGRQGQFEDAVKEFTKALELDPNNAFRHLSLGLGLERLGKNDDAISQCRTAVELDPKFVEARLQLGELLMREHRADEAIAQFRKANDLRPRWPQTLTGLAWALATRPRCTPAQAKEALALVKPAVAMTRARQPQVLAAYAAAEARVGDYRAAVAAAESAIGRAVAAGMTPLAEQIQAQLGCYIAHKPFIDGPGMPGSSVPSSATSSPTSANPFQRAAVTPAPARTPPPASATPVTPIQTSE